MRNAGSALVVLLVACATPSGRSPGPAGAVPLTDRVVVTPEGSATGWAARCEQGFAVECRELGRAHLLGAGVRADDRLAVALLMKGCEYGEPASCGDLGVLTLLGRGVTQDDAAGLALARRACAAGNAVACSNVATLGAEALERSPGRPGREDGAGPRIARAFQVACEAGAAEGCLDLATVRERGELVERDLPGAALAFRRACDAGLPLACHRLALLAAASPAAAPGIDVAALERLACRAAIGPACDPGEAPGRVGPRTPTSRLVAEPSSLALGIPGAGGFHSTDLQPRPEGARRPRARLGRLGSGQLAALPAPLRQRLARDGPTGDDPAPDEPVELLLRLRRAELATCLERERSRGEATRLAAVFLLEPDGRPGGLRAATDPEDQGLEACAAEVIRGWAFPVPDGGGSGPHLVRFDFEAAPPGAPARPAATGLLRATLAEPGCPERHLGLPEAYRGVASAVTVKLVVDAAGRTALLHALTPAPDAVIAAVGEAASACRFTPGVGEDGWPVASWLTLTVRLGGR